MNIKSVLIVSFTLLFTSQAKSDEVEILHIWMADGTETTVQLYTRPQVIFGANVVRVVSPVQELEYPASDVVRFTYSGIPVATEVSSMQDTPQYRQDGENLYFSGNLTADKIQLFTSDGKSLPVNIRQSGSKLSLSLSDIPQGIYILSVNGKTTKLSVK